MSDGQALGAASASAPASIGNVGVGFDVLGQALDAARDRVTAVREWEAGVRLGEVSGLVDSLPDSPDRNTALAAAKSLLDATGAGFGVRISIEKGVPISAGMGGSAASAVAAVVAVNALLPRPLEQPDLLKFAIEGERVSSDPPPWDNVAASLLGGLVLVASESDALVRALPAPPGVVSILFHPSVKVETHEARRLLRSEVPMAVAVEHSRRLASFVAGCALGDLELVRAGFEDLLVEPQRAHLLPVFGEVKRAALRAGALGCSFSGSGPSVFAWATKGAAPEVEAAMAQVFRGAGMRAQPYRAQLDSPGARLDARPSRRRAA